MIEVLNLTKKYGSHTAVNNISFTVSAGEIVGFLGPNGAGKTTTMNIMTGFNSATAGSVKIGGMDILDEPEKAKKHIGYLPDTPPLYGDMTVMEYLRFVCDIKSVKGPDRKPMLNEIMEITKITDVSKRIIKNLSKGYRQRVGLAQSLVGFPDVLIFDEPTVGLDPKQIIETRDVIKTLGRKHTVILSSHILSEVSVVCDRVIIINKGEIVASDTPTMLAQSLIQGNKLSLRVKGADKDIKNALLSCDVLTDVSVTGSLEDGCCDVSVEGSPEVDIREAVFFKLASHNLPIYKMNASDLTLEEIFLQVTGDDQHADNADDNHDENAGDESKEAVNE